MGPNLEIELKLAIGREIGKIDHFCSSWEKAPNLAVHELRKSFKRLRSLFRFYKNIPEFDSDQMKKKAREFGKMLSPLRESYINAGLAQKEMAELTSASESGITRAAAALQRKNDDYIERDSGMGDICRRVTAFYAGNELQLPKVRDDAFFGRLIISEIKSSYSRSYESHRMFRDDVTAEELHSLRKKLKRLYYQMDFIRRFVSSIFSEMTRELDAINDLLGDDHDLHVLEEELRSPEYDLPGEDLGAVGRRVSELRKEILLALLPRLKGFFSMTPDELEGVLAGELMMY